MIKYFDYLKKSFRFGLPNHLNLKDMIDKTIAIYSFLNDILKKINYTEPAKRKASDAEVFTTALFSAYCFGGYIEHAINFVKSTGLMPNMLGKSRFNRRIHAIFYFIVDLFFHIGNIIKDLNISSEYVIDSYPVPVCENIRISRSKLIKGKQYRGYKASMKKYFYGFTVQVIATIDGIPVEFAIHPGSYHDIDGIKICLSICQEAVNSLVTVLILIIILKMIYLMLKILK